MYTLGITPLPKGSLGLPFAPKFRPSDEGGGRGDEEGCAQRSWPGALCALRRPRTHTPRTRAVARVI
eukprot:3962533-Prymnesium_polylepis.1